MTPSYNSATAKTPLLGDTIGGNLARAVAARPDREVLIDVAQGKRYTYRQFDAETDALALALLADGVAIGDRVGIWAPNCAEWMITQYATAKIGAILVTINPAYRTSELEFALNQSGISVLVTARQFKTSDYAAMVAEVGPRCSALRRVVHIGEEFDALVETGRSRDSASLADVPLHADQPINIQYTSGTSTPRAPHCLTTTS